MSRCTVPTKSCGMGDGRWERDGDVVVIHHNDDARRSHVTIIIILLILIDDGVAYVLYQAYVLGCTRTYSTTVARSSVRKE